MDRFQFRITLGTEDEWRRIKDRLGRDLGGSSLSGRLRGDDAEIAGIHIPLAIVFLCGALLAGTILEAPGTLAGC